MRRPFDKAQVPVRLEGAELWRSQVAQPAARGERPPVLLALHGVLEDLGNGRSVRRVAGGTPVANALGEAPVQLRHARRMPRSGGLRIAPMPLFEVRVAELLPFRRLAGGAELYEKQIEDLFWDNPETFAGEALFRVARQPPITGGGRPDVLLLDSAGRVVVAEVKRDVDRGQLAQCLEYAGWGRTTSLDEMAKLYYRGQAQFFIDWQEFTRTATPATVNRRPRLLLIARDFHDRTGSALRFLVENGVPVELVRVSLYEDNGGRRLLDIENERGDVVPEPSPDKLETPVVTGASTGSGRVSLADLIEAGLVQPGQRLTWVRPKIGATHEATVMENGAIQLQNGGVYSSPSRAALEAAGSGSYDGWEIWRLGGPEGPLLLDVRRKYLELRAATTT